MEHTSKGAQLLRQHTAKAATKEGAKWTPETGWTDAATKVRAIRVTGRRWTDANNNTYHTATVYADGVEVAHVPFTYGYESAFEDTAAKAMEAAGLMPGREHYKNGGSEAPFRYWERQGIRYQADAVDVKRRKDL